jgi:type II secretory pathway pseudopilin PulG
MAALIVAMSIMAVMMTVAMPVWKQIAQREKEEELVFRGEQYARAIGLFQRKFANSPPPNLDVLVDQRFLRKKYKDPITNDDFAIVLQTQNVPGATPGGGRGAATPGGLPPAAPPAGGAPMGRGPAGLSAAGGTARQGFPGSGPGVLSPGSVGGIMGVTSKSKDKSIRLYKGRSHYNEWQFVYTRQTPMPGGVPGAVLPGGRGRGRQGGPGQPPSPTSPFGQPAPPGGPGGTPPAMPPPRPRR